MFLSLHIVSVQPAAPELGRSAASVSLGFVGLIFRWVRIRSDLLIAFIADNGAALQRHVRKVSFLLGFCFFFAPALIEDSAALRAPILAWAWLRSRTRRWRQRRDRGLFRVLFVFHRFIVVRAVPQLGHSANEIRRQLLRLRDRRSRQLSLARTCAMFPSKVRPARTCRSSR